MERCKCSYQGVAKRLWERRMAGGLLLTRRLALDHLMCACMPRKAACIVYVCKLCKCVGAHARARVCACLHTRTHVAPGSRL